jgi:hypothetical protein
MNTIGSGLTLFPGLHLRWSVLFLGLLSLLLASCSIRPYQSSDIDVAPFLQRSLTQENNQLRVTAAVPDAGEVEALTGLDLYKQNIQPVWLKVENRGENPVRLAPWSIDPNYFSPIEVAYKNRKKFSKQGYVDMERWFYENALPRQIPPGETRSGLFYTNLEPGTKGFTLDVFSNKVAHSFTFFVPMPGFTADYTEVDFSELYQKQDIRHLTQAEFKPFLEDEFPCCGTDASGELAGAPLNVIMVGSGLAVRRSLMRGGWEETSVGWKEEDTSRAQHVYQRKADAIFYLNREDGNERLEINLWMAPLQVDSEPVWVGQVYYALDEQNFLADLAKEANAQDSKILSAFVQDSVSSDIDSALSYLFQNLWYNQSLRKLGLVGGVGEVPVDNPRATFTGVGYFTEGIRAVLFLSEDPLALDEGEFIYRKQAERPSSASVDLSVPTNSEERPLFRGKQVPPPNDRLHIDSERSLTIATAVPSAEETRKIFGADLYKKNIQPVWIQVENRSDNPLFLTPMGLDPSYYTARETARRSKGNDNASGRGRQFEETGLVRLEVPANSIQSSYIFSRVDEGTKSFNVDVIGDGDAYGMSFFVPVPGLRLDHYEVDLEGLYPESELQHIDSLEQLVTELEQMPCCVRDAKGENKGDPLNLVFVADIQDLYYAFLRAGWDETETIYGTSLLKTVTSAVTGGSYRYSPVSALYVFGRAQDTAMQRARSSINERNHLRIWLSPLRLEGKPVWIGQISRDIGVHLTAKTITTHKIDPNVDETREFLVEDLAYAQALLKLAHVGGVGAAPYDQPRGNLTGDPYFTDGKRVVMWLSGEPTSISEIEIVDLSPYAQVEP